MHFHFHNHSDPILRDIALKVGSIAEGQVKMSAALDRLTGEVEETKTAVDSALTLIDGLADQIRELKDDPAKLEALADELDAKQREIAEKVVANTTPA